MRPGRNSCFAINGASAMWDNQQTMHRGTPFDDTRYARDMRRVTVLEGGEAA